MARSNVTGQLAALLTALEAQEPAQADAAAARLAAAVRRDPEGVQSISTAAFDKLMCHLSSPTSERAYEAAARATCACLLSDSDGTIARRVCCPVGRAAALTHGLTSRDAALRSRVLLALPCVFDAMLDFLTAEQQLDFSVALAQAPGVPAAVGRLLGGSDASERDMAAELLSKMLHATPPAATPAAAEVARQPGALPGLIAAAGVDELVLIALNAWQCVVYCGVATLDLARAIAEAGARGALRRVAGAAGRVLSDGLVKDKDFLCLANGLAELCQDALAAAAVAANAEVVSAMRRELRSGARAEAAMRLLLVLRTHSVWARTASPRRDGGVHLGGGSAAADGGGGGGSGGMDGGGGDGGEGGGSLGDPGLLADVVRAASSADVRVCLLAFRFIGYGDDVWSVPLMAPVAVSALRKLDWELTERASLLMCGPLTPATAATLLALGAPDALRAAAAAAAALPAGGGAAAGSCPSDGGPEQEDAWPAALWAAVAAIKLPLDAAASGAGRTGPATPADSPPWALDLLSAALSGAFGAAPAARALGVMCAVAPAILKALVRHPGLLRGLGAFVASCGDPAVVGLALGIVKTLTKLEQAACASDDTQGDSGAACGGKRGGPAAALAELRRWLSVLFCAPDRVVAGEAAAGLAAFDALRPASSGDCGSGRGGGNGGGNDAGEGASAERGAVASRGVDSSGEVAGSAGASTSQQVTAAQSPQQKGRPIRSCSVCGQTEAQLGRAPKACAGCRQVRYCGEACARAAWPAHKKECKEAQQKQQQLKQQTQPQQAQQAAEKQQQQQ